LVPHVELEPEKAHFVSRYREYSVVCATEPDRVNSSGEIVRGVNKAVRFRDFNLITSDPVVIKKLRALDQYGLGREVWEKHQQDKQIAERSMAAAESAIEALPPELQAAMVEKLTARFKTFQLPVSNVTDEDEKSKN